MPYLSDKYQTYMAHDSMTELLRCAVFLEKHYGIGDLEILDITAEEQRSLEIQRRLRGPKDPGNLYSITAHREAIKALLEGKLKPTGNWPVEEAILFYRSQINRLMTQEAMAEILPTVMADGMLIDTF